MNPDLERRRTLAATRTAAARERVKMIRTRVAVGTATLFAAVWVGVFGQLVAGRDPALGSGIGSKTTRASAARPAESTTSGATASSPSPASTAPTTTTNEVAPQPPPTIAATPMTTRQS